MYGKCYKLISEVSWETNASRNLFLSCDSEHVPSLPTSSKGLSGTCQEGDQVQAILDLPPPPLWVQPVSVKCGTITYLAQNDSQKHFPIVFCWHLLDGKSVQWHQTGDKENSDSAFMMAQIWSTSLGYLYLKRSIWLPFITYPCMCFENKKDI